MTEPSKYNIQRAEVFQVVEKNIEREVQRKLLFKNSRTRKWVGYLIESIA